MPSKSIAQQHLMGMVYAYKKGADWSDADANRYGGDLDKLQTKVEKLNAERRKVMDAIMNYRMG
jgi:hypothetical protein